LEVWFVQAHLYDWECKPSIRAGEQVASSRPADHCGLFSCRCHTHIHSLFALFIWSQSSPGVPLPLPALAHSADAGRWPSCPRCHPARSSTPAG
jgi:hypothetical protein